MRSTLASEAVSGAFQPNLKALYYHADNVSPWWAKGMEVECKVGHQIFYLG